MAATCQSFRSFTWCSWSKAYLEVGKGSQNTFAPLRPTYCFFLTMRERGWRGGHSSAHTAQLSNFTCDKIPLFCDFPLRGLSNGKVTVCFIHCLLNAADSLSRRLCIQNQLLIRVEK